ncbi:exodeoxyribonuclease I [Gilvimarinus algae]|uniref:Exodeoxyribonuclease I n=1 Tax=Gilvimarinus algae TaxID=3058037 RepID=A0ABT8TE96_9GAMM|nr:exodeoxyribonuclease I [Gilvimarinus sp. SDUM040014]MDO3381864.1 exodeoxyribonuclease I [Gilvimarinus sp. SDUM040014]
MHTFYWHDYETWGEVPALDRPSQFAGVRTDADLNIIGEPLMIYCKPPPDLLPKPQACLVTSLTPQHAQRQGLCEADFMAQIHTELATAGTCAVGYNSIRFDDEVTRYGLYRNFYDPYEREWKNGNSRWDLIDVVRMTRALRPEGIEWPNYEDGSPCFKLEALSAANQLEHGSAHDALSDVYATIALAQLVRRRQPRLFDYAFKLRNKRFVADLIDIDAFKPVLHISSMFASQQGNAALVVPLAYHPQNKNSVIAYNLAIDPIELFSLPAEELAGRLFTPKADLPEGVERLALKEIHLNKSPMVLPVAMLDEQTEQRLGLDRALCEQHWRRFSAMTLVEATALRAKLAKLYQLSAFAPRTDPETMLYDGFFDDHDKALMRRVRQSSPAALAEGNFDFHDPRLAELLWRYRARNFPETLNQSELERWRVFCLQRLTQPEAGASLIKSQFDEEIARLAQQESLSEAQRELLAQLAGWSEKLLAEARSGGGEGN